MDATATASLAVGCVRLCAFGRIDVVLSRAPPLVRHAPAVFDKRMRQGQPACPPTYPHHSARSVVIGSTRAARCAGTHAAHPAMAMSSTATPPKTMTSFGCTSTRSRARKWPSRRPPRSRRTAWRPGARVSGCVPVARRAPPGHQSHAGAGWRRKPSRRRHPLPTSRAPARRTPRTSGSTGAATQCTTSSTCGMVSTL